MLYDFTMRYFDYSCFDDALLFQQRIIMLHLAQRVVIQCNLFYFCNFHKLILEYWIYSTFFIKYTKGQLNSEWICEAIVSPKFKPKITRISALPNKQGL